MLICDSCLQGHHMACCGLSSIPEGDEWVCSGCAVLQQLDTGSQLVLESPQVMYEDGSDPHLTQGLFTATLSSIDAAQRCSSGLLRHVHLDISDAPLPGSVRFFSARTHEPLRKVPRASQQLRDLLYTRTGSQASSVTLCSSRYAMFSSCAAAAGLASGAWLAGNAAQAIQLLAGPARQLHLLRKSSSGGGSSSSR
jgi:hypothetical protein